VLMDVHMPVLDGLNATRRIRDDAAIPADVDLVVWLVHLLDDEKRIERYRARGGRALIVGWFWDNHHHLFENYAAARQCDFVVAGHAFAGSYLANRNAVALPPVPLCVTQWTATEARDFWAQSRVLERSDELYGGFVWYAFAEKRNRLLEALIGAGERQVYLLYESDLSRYFARSREERFREWAGYKVSLCLPLHDDLSQRMFDALLTGQIPLVPASLPDLPQVLTAAKRAALPIVTFDEMTVDSVRKAARSAVRLFDRSGPAGAERRHRYAVEHATLPARIETLLKNLREWSVRR